MRKGHLFAAAAFILAAGVGLWAASTTHAHVSAPYHDRYDPVEDRGSVQGLMVFY